MNEAIVVQWLQRNWSIWLAFVLAFIPPLIGLRASLQFDAKLLAA